MPATAKRRSLKDPFDPVQAIPASAAYLAELSRVFGNFGLAAAAYNLLRIARLRSCASLAAERVPWAPAVR